MDEAEAVLLMGVAETATTPVDIDEPPFGAAIVDGVDGAGKGAGCGHHDGFVCSGLQS